MEFGAYKLLNESVLAVAKSINVLQEVPQEKKERQFRLESNPHAISRASGRNCSAVTAHDLSQYKNKVYTIVLQESNMSWLDKLLSVGQEGGVVQWN